MNKKKAMTFTTHLLMVAVVTMILCLPSVVLVPPFLTPSSPLDKSIVKQFVYDTLDPIIGLNVDLYDGALTAVDSGVTNATGHVKFIGLTDQTYTIKWMWCGAEDSETIEVTCDQCVFTLTNTLQSKSGGGLNSAESAR